VECGMDHMVEGWETCLRTHDISNDMESNDDGENEHFKGDDGIMEFDGLTTVKQNDFPMGGIVRSSEIINS